MVQADDRVPEGTHGDAGYRRLPGLREHAVHGADHEVQQLVCVFHRAAVRGVLELVVELDLGSLYLVTCIIVEFGPHRRGANVYR